MKVLKYYILALLGISSYSLLAQNLILTELDSLPSGEFISKSKVSGNDLYLRSGRDIYKKENQQDWKKLIIDSPFNWVRDFDVNNFGQIIASVRDDVAGQTERRFMITDDDFSTFEVLPFPTGGFSINYVAKDTIILASGGCSDASNPNTRYSTDGGISWVQTNFRACNSSPNFKRIGNTIHWYGQFGGLSQGPGSDVVAFSHQSFSLDDFTGTSPVYSFNAVTEDFLNYIINDNGSKYFHRDAFDQDTTYNVSSFYSSNIEGDIVEVGEGNFGMLYNGPLGNDAFVVNNSFSNSRIYYKQNPQDDLIELTTNIDISDVRNVILSLIHI